MQRRTSKSKPVGGRGPMPADPMQRTRRPKIAGRGTAGRGTVSRADAGELPAGTATPTRPLGGAAKSLRRGTAKRKSSSVEKGRKQKPSAVQAASISGRKTSRSNRIDSPQRATPSGSQGELDETRRPKAENLSRIGAIPAAVPPSGEPADWAGLATALQRVFFDRFRWSQRGWCSVTGQGTPEAPASPKNQKHRSVRIPWRVIRNDVESLHKAYTATDGPTEGDDNPIQRYLGGYQFYYLLRNAFRVNHVLNDLPWSEVNPGASSDASRDELGHIWTRDGVLRVLDLGAGSGAFSLGLLLWLSGRQLLAGSDNSPIRALERLEFDLVDQGHGLLELARANVLEGARILLPGIQVTIRLRAHGIARELSSRRYAGAYAVVGGAMVLNELRALGAGRRETRSRALFEGIRRCAMHGGVLLFVEPGTRKGYLNIMAARTALAELPILHPCPHGQVCPMYEPHARRWCHTTLRLPHPFALDDRLRHEGGLQLRMKEINLAALAVQAVEGPIPKAPFEPRAGQRVVSAPLPMKQHSRRVSQKESLKVAPRTDWAWLTCTPQGRLDEVSLTSIPQAGRGAWRKVSTTPSSWRDIALDTDLDGPGKTFIGDGDSKKQPHTVIRQGRKPRSQRPFGSGRASKKVGRKRS